MSTVLIIEDDRYFGALVARRLSERGWTTLHAAGVAEARAQLAVLQPDLLLLDLALPDGSGWELSQLGVPVIVVTCGDVTAQERSRYRPQAVCIKPVGLAQLLELIETLTKSGREGGGTWAGGLNR
jgi:DNA-binding response OmpR family regulator